MNKGKAFIVNMAASVLTFLISFGISFLFTPYITAKVGGEAYGFVGLANNLINYVTIITVALNSVAGRFITVKYHQNRIEEANQYFTSVLVANALMAAIISAVAIPFILVMEKFINIPVEIQKSVKLLFFFILLNFVLTLIGTVYTTATFITNKLYLSSIANVIVALLKVFILCLFFGFLEADVAFIGVATFASSLVGLIINMVYTQKLLPDIKLKKAYISVQKTKELFMSGIWSSITKLSSILADGLDLIITNLMISSYYMGQLSIAQTIPNYLVSLLGMITSLFNPNLTKNYAQDNVPELVSELKVSMKLTGFFTNILFSCILVLGSFFYKLWVPNEDYTLIHQLTIVIMISTLTSGVTTGLSNIFLITNKLKVNSIFWLCISMLDVVLVFILLNVTNWGIFAVAGVSKVVGLIVNLTYLPIYSAKCLKVKWTTFYPIIFRYMGTTLVMVGAFAVIRGIYGTANSWISFLVLLCICGVIGCLINYFMLFNKEEHKIVNDRVLRIIRRK